MVQNPAPKRIMLAAPASDAGKTTVTCALLAALSRRGQHIQAFKCGPDFIDPMFHSRITGTPCHNLDLFLCGERGVLQLMNRCGGGADLCVLEGVMGFYDGRDATPSCSSWAVSQLTQTPVLLVLEPGGMAASLEALLRGFCGFRPNRIAGVLFNRIQPSLYPFYSRFARQAGLEPCGFLPDVPGASLESRHLGLVTAAEIPDFDRRMALLADAAEQYVDFEALDRISALAGALPPAEPLPPVQTPPVPVRIAVARDEAFCFYYAANLDLLERAGAQLTFFSPLRDPALPPHTDGLWLGGGYPELYGRQLQQNASLRAEIAAAVRGGLPALAECGGFLYLQSRLTDAAGETFEMAGALPGESHMTAHLSHFGYTTLQAKSDNLLGPAGMRVPAHEFHCSVSSDDGGGWEACSDNGRRACVFSSPTLYAGYPHLHFYADPAMAARFVAACARRAGLNKEASHA